MSPEGKVSVVVESRRVPVRTMLVQHPIYSSSGVLLGSSARLAVVYDTVLDESHVQAIKEAKKLSCNLDLDFEVVDRAKVNPLWRLVSRALGKGQAEPSLVLATNSHAASR